MHFSKVASVLALPLAAFAWLPGHDKQIFTRDGLDLFNRSAVYGPNDIHKRTLPSVNKIRGVNLGSLFIMENWMAHNVWANWGCNTQSEFDCVSSLNNQGQANSLFQNHWNNWISPSDFSTMVSYGLNTVRIPVGYWFMESIVDSSEHFPQGGERYLDQVVGWAKNAGLYVIIDFHGLPGGQAYDAFTGQYNSNPGFYNDYNYGRAYKWLEWMTNKIHTNSAYSTVGMLEVVNEPERVGDSRYPNAQSNTNSMRQTFYPNAYKTIRNKESALGVSSNNLLHIQMMDQLWGSGDPNQYLPSGYTKTAYDDHSYVKYAGVADNQDAYISHSCNDNRSGNKPVIVGEWSISTNNDEWPPASNKNFYNRWFAAQVKAYEKGDSIGWVFWNWKTDGLNDPRWDYNLGVQQGIILKKIDDAYTIGVC